jgi:DNA-3-methyladenine glycosylase
MASRRRFRRSFFARSALDVAPDLLGRLLVVGTGQTEIAVVINETEAYTADDPASHSFRGPTKRNASMFGPPGHLYTYFTYGMHWCANVVTGPEGTGEAVLLRGGVVQSGIDVVLVRRNNARNRPVSERNLTNGPAKLCQALCLDGAADGLDLCAPAAIVRIFKLGAGPTPFEATPRIGISVGQDRLWRFRAVDHVDAS